MQSFGDGLTVLVKNRLQFSSFEYVAMVPLFASETTSFVKFVCTVLMNLLYRQCYINLYLREITHPRVNVAENFHFSYF